MFVAKIATRLHVTNFCTSLTRFALSVVWQPKSPKCTQIVQNAPKCVFRVQWVRSGAFIAKNSDATLWDELVQRFCPFCTEFCKASPKCTKIVRNAPKHEFGVQWGGSGVFVAKSSNATSWHELSHQFCTFSIMFCEPTK